MTMKTLYYFSSPDLVLIEIKRDLGPHAQLSEIYKWLVIEEHQITTLKFVSMKDSEREFEQGSLNFNDESGVLNFISRDYILKRHAPEDLPLKLISRVSEYLSS